jgi:hypothetical protein
MKHDSSPSGRIGAECPVRHFWLVRFSLILAFFLEVLPLEMDVVGVLWSQGLVLRALAAKLCCVSAIGLPLVVYVILNGVDGLKYAKVRVAIIALIVLTNMFFILALLSGRKGVF